MKKLQNNFTTPEQSKLLLEIGVPADSADCYYLRMQHEEFENPRICYMSYFNHTCLHPKIFIYLPCWSVGRLIEIENICSIPKIKEAGFHLMRTDFDDLIETMFISIRMKIEHGWIDFSKLEE